ncbi:MAG: cytochrome c biogenesis protein CcdA [Actinomycetota bacterium]|nr:cytochrome c biogenesis protein CcdA [Actinomycetota bacterium]
MTLVGPFALALVAGVVSFTSPCCLPLMPGYVSFVGGAAGDRAGDVRVQSRTLVAAALFVGGFATTFTLMGLGASMFGSLLLAHREALTRIAGVFVGLMGLATMGVLRVPWMYREIRPGMRRVRPGRAGAFPLGVAFAIGWTPCIGPVLGAILAGAATSGGVWRGGALLLVYSLGLGVPFMLLAFGFARGGRVFGFLRRRGRAIEIVGGALLIAMGALMITGEWARLFTPALRWFARSGWPPV